MAISLKTAGTWARMVTDGGSVAIPGTPAAGDRMFLFGSWKDFSVTVATPSGWTLIDDFSDGSVSATNGGGSVHNAVYYRDWQSGDANPVIDYSAAPTEGHWVIMLWTKAGGDVWSTPTAVHAAIAATDPFSATSSATITIPDNSVVMCLVGLRDDSTTLARSTTSIGDDGSPAITWNGNYVESPATHFNSTTGLDMSGDLGHRFVTTGASGVNLTIEGDPVAAESGTATWIVQGLAFTQTYTPALLNQAAATFSPTVTSLATVSVALIGQEAATFAPTVTTLASIVVGQISQTASPFTPSAIQQQFYTPALIDQTATTSAPTISSTYGVTLDLIDRTATAFDPQVASGGAAPIWTTPANGVAMPPNPELKFTIPSMASPMHFNLQLDTVNTFDSGNLRDIRSDLDQTNWAFWDGDSWEPIPVGGVDESFAGNEARYSVSPDLTSTTWYRRVRAGTS